MHASALKEEFVDPVCGMTVDPARAAGTSERDGVRYYFCSPGCKQRFDAAGPGDAVPQSSCCGGAAEAPMQLSAAPVQLTSVGRAQARPAHQEHAHHQHAVA